MRVGGCPAVVAQWQNTGGSSRRCPGFDSRRLPTAGFFLYFRLIISKFIYFQREARCFQHLNKVRKPLRMGSPDGENFRSTPNGALTAHTEWLPDGDWGIQYHLRTIHRGLWGLVVVRLSWLSGRTLAAQAGGVLGSTPSDCRLFSLSSIFAS